jgi:ribosome-associated toxin RatA of RatAB toxin-antitoxin module
VNSTSTNGRPSPVARGLALIFIGSLCWAPTAAAQDLMSLLKKGPVVSVETKKNGRFHSATAVIDVKASVQTVWRVITDYASFKTFLPNVEESEVKRITDYIYDVSYEVEVPGSNPEYTFRYILDPTKHTVTCGWKEGDLEGSFCKWRLVSMGPKRTLIYFTTASRNFSSLAESLEDDQQTITVGVNVSAALATVRAMKRRSESR